MLLREFLPSTYLVFPGLNLKEWPWHPIRHNYVTIKTDTFINWRHQSAIGVEVSRYEGNGDIIVANWKFLASNLSTDKCFLGLTWQAEISLDRIFQNIKSWTVSHIISTYVWRKHYLPACPK